MLLFCSICEQNLIFTTWIMNIFDNEQLSIKDDLSLKSFID